MLHVAARYIIHGPMYIPYHIATCLCMELLGAVHTLLVRPTDTVAIRVPLSAEEQRLPHTLSQHRRRWRAWVAVTQGESQMSRPRALHHPQTKEKQRFSLFPHGPVAPILRHEIISLGNLSVLVEMSLGSTCCSAEKLVCM